MSSLTLVKHFGSFSTNIQRPTQSQMHLLPPTGQNWCARRWNTTTSGVNTPRFTLTQTTPLNTKMHAITCLAFHSKQSALNCLQKLSQHQTANLLFFSTPITHCCFPWPCVHVPPGPLEQSRHVFLYASLRFCCLCEFSLWLCLGFCYCILCVSVYWCDLVKCKIGAAEDCRHKLGQDKNRRKSQKKKT